MNYLLFPKFKKYNKYHINKFKNINKKITLTYGDWGIISSTNGIITSNQIESSRCIFSRNMKNIGKIWIKIFPDQAISKKSKNSRMGSGKGDTFKWVYIIKPKTVIFEATIISFKIITKIFKEVKHKLPINIKLIYK